MKNLLLVAAMIFSANTWAAEKQDKQKLLNELATILNQKTPTEKSFYYGLILCFPGSEPLCVMGNHYASHPNAFTLAGAKAQKLMDLLLAFGFTPELTISGNEQSGQSFKIYHFSCESTGGNFACEYQQPLKLKNN